MLAIVNKPTTPADVITEARDLKVDVYHLYHHNIHRYVSLITDNEH